MSDEFYEDDAPAHPKSRPAAAAPSTSPETHLLGCCLVDGDNGLTLARTVKDGITPEHFALPANRLIYATLLRTQVTDLALLGSELESQRQLSQVGGWPYLMELTSGIPTTAHYAHYCAKLKEAHLGKALDRIRLTIQDRAKDDPETVLADLQAQVRKLTDGAKPQGGVLPARPVTSFAYPADSDPNILLGNDDYLGRGGGMLFVSHAGAGKSSWIMDACMMWALGLPWMGIKCAKPLRSIIIQAEDSDRYIGKIFTSFAHVNKLTAEQVALLSENCLIIRLKGIAGAAFEAEVARLTTLHSPDLVVINPIYLYAEGDIGRSEFAQPFLAGLDRINKAEKFAYILIHHTGKPAKQTNGKKADLDDWESAYMGFGSSYFANWPRCTALLEPIAATPGKFCIRLGKGGLNAGVVKTVEQGAGTRTEPTTKIAIKHSQERMDVNGQDKPVYYWELDTDTAEPEARPGASKGGRPTKYTMEEFIKYMPVGKDKAMSAAQIHRVLVSGISINSFKDLLGRNEGKGLVMMYEKPGTGHVFYAGF